MRLLHFRRTFVKKLFAIHGKVELRKRDGRPIGSYARHYYDLFQLGAQPDVIAMLSSDEYAAIKSDYDEIRRAHFPQSYFPPDGMSFAASDALFPPTDLAATLGADRDPGALSRAKENPLKDFEDGRVRFPLPVPS